MRSAKSVPRRVAATARTTPAWLAGLALAWGLLSASSVAADSAPAPAGAFATLDGAPASVAAHIGSEHWLVVLIWASDCQVCNLEAEAYAQLHEAHKDSGIRLLGLSIDGAGKRAAAKEFVERHDLPFPSLIGEPAAVSVYHAQLTGGPLLGTPTLIVFDPQGRVSAAQAGAVAPDAIVRYVALKRGAATAP